VSRIYLRHQRFGRLTALLPVSRDQYGIRWACKCDCGWWAIRTAAQLRYAIANHAEPCCRLCAKRQWSTLNDDARARRRIARLAYWKRYGSLYGVEWSARVAEQVKQDLVAAFGATAEPIPVCVAEQESAQDHDGEISLSLQEVAEEFGLCRERVRQIEARAMRKLRHPSRSRLMRPFVDDQISDADINRDMFWPRQLDRWERWALDLQQQAAAAA
jgi:Sigma-70, region 4